MTHSFPTRLSSVLKRRVSSCKGRDGPTLDTFRARRTPAYRPIGTQTASHGQPHGVIVTSLCSRCRNDGAWASRSAIASSNGPLPGPPSGSDALSPPVGVRSEEHTSEIQYLMRIPNGVFCCKKKK